MRQFARVSSIDALKQFKQALAEFRTIATTALDEAQADVQRTAWWIEHDQLSHWQIQLRKRATKLAQAKSELFRAQVASPDQRVSATLERKAVEKAEALVEEAESKIAAVKRWGRVLEREILLYRGQCQQLARAIEGDLPQALLRLDRMVEALEKYVQLTAPTSDPRLPAPSPDPGEPGQPAGSGPAATGAAVP